MRILLQRSESGLYYEDVDSWTTDRLAAKDFVSSTAAMDFCAANNLAGVHIVLRFDEEKREIVLPAIPAQPGQRQRPTQSF